MYKTLPVFHAAKSVSSNMMGLEMERSKLGVLLYSTWLRLARIHLHNFTLPATVSITTFSTNFPSSSLTLPAMANALGILSNPLNR